MEPTSLREELSRLGSLSESAQALEQCSRSVSDGSEFNKEGDRWVMRPKNFVTLSPHWKTANNVAISLRGNPDEFAELPELPLKEGMGGYSGCTLTSVDQLVAALFYVRRAKQLFERGRTRERRALLLVEPPKTK